MEYKYFASAPDQEYTKEFLKQIREEDLVATKKKMKISLKAFGVNFVIHKMIGFEHYETETSTNLPFLLVK